MYFLQEEEMKNTKTYRVDGFVKLSFFALFLTSIFSGCSMDKPAKSEAKNEKKVLTDIVISSVKLGEKTCVENGEVETEADTAALAVEFAESYAGLTVKVNGEAASVTGKTAELNLKGITEAGIPVKIIANGTDKNEKVFSFTAKKVLPVKPKLLRLQVKNAASDELLFSTEDFTNNEINAGAFDDIERVKIIADVETGASVTYHPALENENEFPLKVIGENSLNIILTKNGLSNAYIVKITRNAPSVVARKVKAVKADFGWMANLASAASAEKDAVLQNQFNLTLPHTKANQRCSLFIEGEDTEDIVILSGKPDKFQANNSAIHIGNTPVAGGTGVFEFYLFQKDADTTNMGLGTKFTLKITVASEPNTKITSIKFNNIEGKIDSSSISCDEEFEIDTVINTVVVCEAPSSTVVINDNNEVKITAAGAEFNISVIPEEGETWKQTYTVKLNAKIEFVKRITSIKYATDSVPSSEDDLSETSTRDTGDNNFTVSYTSGSFAFLPVTSEGEITEVQIKEWNGYKKQNLYNNLCYYIQRPHALNGSGITIRVIFSDKKADEFLIKK